MAKLVQNLSIAKKLRLATLFVVVLFLVNFYGFYLSSQKILRGLSDLREEEKFSEALSRAQQVPPLLIEILEKTKLESSAVRESQQTFLEGYHRIASTMEEMGQLGNSKQTYTLQINAAQKSLEFLRQAAQLFYESASRGEKGSARRDLFVSKQFSLDFEESLGKLKLEVERRFDLKFEDLYRTRYFPLTIAIILTVIFSAVALSGGWVLTSRFRRSVFNLLHATEKVSGGDVLFQAQVISQDEIGTLTHEFNKMIKTLHETTVSKDQVSNQNIALTMANQELESFSYSVSHDLRTPLRGVDGFSKALLDDYGDKLNDQGKDYLRRIRAATQRMGRLIDELLNLSRIIRKEMQVKVVNLSEIAMRVAEELHRYEPHRKVKFMIEPGISVVGDAELLLTVLENLLGNAWKFTSKHPQATIEFGKKIEGGKTVFFVRDDGAGFEMAYAQKMFGAFQRLHTENEFPGTGVGLANVQRIVHRHGGRIWAEGQTERGAVFYFTLETALPVVSELLGSGKERAA